VFLFLFLQFLLHCFAHMSVVAQSFSNWRDKRPLVKKQMTFRLNTKVILTPVAFFNSPRDNLFLVNVSQSQQRVFALGQSKAKPKQSQVPKTSLPALERVFLTLLLHYRKHSHDATFPRACNCYMPGIFPAFAAPLLLFLRLAGPTCF